MDFSFKALLHLRLDILFVIFFFVFIINELKKSNNNMMEVGKNMLIGIWDSTNSSVLLV